MLINLPVPRAEKIKPITVGIWPFVLSAGANKNTIEPIRNNIIGNYVALNPPILSDKYPYVILAK